MQCGQPRKLLSGLAATECGWARSRPRACRPLGRGLLAKAREAIGVHPRVADRSAFLAFASGTEVGVRVDQRFVTLAVAHVLGRRSNNASVSWIRSRPVGYHLDANRVRLGARGRRGRDRGQEAGRECQADDNCKIPFHPSAFLKAWASIINLTGRPVMRNLSEESGSCYPRILPRGCAIGDEGIFDRRGIDRLGRRRQRDRSD
jgi:hypothetical protein